MPPAPCVTSLHEAAPGDGLALEGARHSAVGGVLRGLLVAVCWHLLAVDLLRSSGARPVSLQSKRGYERCSPTPAEPSRCSAAIRSSRAAALSPSACSCATREIRSASRAGLLDVADRGELRQPARVALVAEQQVEVRIGRVRVLVVQPRAPGDVGDHLGVGIRRRSRAAAPAAPRRPPRRSARCRARSAPATGNHASNCDGGG